MHSTVVFDSLHFPFIHLSSMLYHFNSLVGARSPLGQTLAELMTNLKTSVQAKVNKNVEVLQLSSQICRRMRGLRFTSCKSAKDRTGMSVTLEQVNILTAEYHLAEHEYIRALDCMRRLISCIEYEISSR